MMIERKTWDEFRKTGLVLIINQILHIFGWAITFNVEDEKVTDCFPGRVKFRGFEEKDVDDSYSKVTRYMKENAGDLLKDMES